MGHAVSKGIINIVLYEIDQTAETVQAFADDANAFVARFRLTDAERHAFEEWDYATLYAMGAHPFLLWQTVRSLAMLDGTPIPELVAQYRERVEPHGWPDHIS